MPTKYKMKINYDVLEQLRKIERSRKPKRNKKKLKTNETRQLGKYRSILLASISSKFMASVLKTAIAS